jgi:UDPglucose 6-dehydrogenase
MAILVDHRAFRDLDPARVSRLVAARRVVDARNVLDRAAWESHGFKVSVLGATRA